MSIYATYPSLGAAGDERSDPLLVIITFHHYSYILCWSSYLIHFCRLKDTLKSVLKQYGTDLELPQLDKFPACIKMNQAVAAWKHIVHYYANLGAL